MINAKEYKKSVSLYKINSSLTDGDLKYSKKNNDTLTKT